MVDNESYARLCLLADLLLNHFSFFFGFANTIEDLMTFATAKKKQESLKFDFE